MKTLPKYSKAQYEVWRWKREVTADFKRETKGLPISDQLLWWNNPENFYKKYPNHRSHRNRVAQRSLGKVGAPRRSIQEVI